MLHSKEFKPNAHTSEPKMLMSVCMLDAQMYMYLAIMCRV